MLWVAAMVVAERGHDGCAGLVRFESWAVSPFRGFGGVGADVGGREPWSW